MLDVLAGVEEIKVCTAYRIDGAETTQFVPDAYDLQRVTPVYTTMAGFSQDISKARKLAELPAEARRYVEFIESQVGVRAEMVGVGPDREQTITS
jgi:adenylosuccinate synthase